MSILVRDDYYQDTLEKRYCKICQKSFIVGEELAGSVSEIVCPYCTGKSNEAVALMNEESNSFEELGCIGIHFHKSDGKYYERCFICGTKLNADDTAGENLCIKCHTTVVRR